MNPKNMVAIAKLIADEARLAILNALLAGRALTAGELARIANISPQTASSHLHKLLTNNLIAVYHQGRHRYYRLATTDVAHVLESLLLISTKKLTQATRVLNDIQYARSCYDHLAGHVAVALTNALLKKHWIWEDGRDYHITDIGIRNLETMGIDVTALLKQKRRIAYPCLDWSERVHHVAGALGAALLHHAIEQRWLLRAQQGRALFITTLGKNKLIEQFDMDFNA